MTWIQDLVVDKLKVGFIGVLNGMRECWYILI